ncbi:MAG: 2-dehydropantoate 2-reductase N-terminal domain-containing protein [Casimicrobiaceae bacterium]
MTTRGAAGRRYVIVGAGAVGGMLAAQFTQAGIKAVLVARGAQLAAIRSNGLRMLRPSGAEVVRLEVVGSPAEVRLAPGDVLVMATKAQHAEAALQEWAWQPVQGVANATAASTLPVLMLQNGLDSERVALRRFATVYSASIWAAATYLKAGEICAAGAPKVGVFWMGRFPSGTDAMLDGIADDLRAAAYLVQVVPDVQRWKVAKLLGNLRNAVQVLDGTEEQRAELTALLAAEAKAAFTAAGLGWSDVKAESTFDLAQYATHRIPDYPDSKLSTWQSFQRGAGSVEVDFLNGEIVLLGRLHGVATPCNEALQRILGISAASSEAPGTRTVDAVLAHRA